MALELGSGMIGRFESKSLQRQHFFQRRASVLHPVGHPWSSFELQKRPQAPSRVQDKLATA